MAWISLRAFANMFSQAQSPMRVLAGLPEPVAAVFRTRLGVARAADVRAFFAYAKKLATLAKDDPSLGARAAEDLKQFMPPPGGAWAPWLARALLQTSLVKPRLEAARRLQAAGLLGPAALARVHNKTASREVLNKRLKGKLARMRG